MRAPWGQGFLSAVIAAAFPASRTHLLWVTHPRRTWGAPWHGGYPHRDAVTCSLSSSRCIPRPWGRVCASFIAVLPPLSIRDGKLQTHEIQTYVSPRTERCMEKKIRWQLVAQALTPSCLSTNVTLELRSPIQRSIFPFISPQNIYDRTICLWLFFLAVSMRSGTLSSLLAQRAGAQSVCCRDGRLKYVLKIYLRNH